MACRDLEAAIDQFRASAELLPHLKTLELLGECLLTTGRPRDAIVPLAAATALNEQVRAPSLLASALLQVGEYWRAGLIARQVIQVSPGNRLASAVLADAHVSAELQRHG